MNEDRMTLAAVRAFIVQLNIGDEFKLRWADADDPTVILSWTCKISAKPTADSAHFRSVDSDEPETDWEFPCFKEGHSDPPTEAELDLCYYYMAKTQSVVGGKKSMKNSNRASLAKTTIIAWKPATWISWLKPGDLLARNVVVTTIFEQLLIPERIHQQSFKTVEDWEACALGEILISTIDLLLVCTEEVRNCPQMDRVLTNNLSRLCELKIGRGKSGEARTKAMATVRNAFLGNQLVGDNVSRVMMGLPLPSNSGSTSGT